MHRNRIVLLSFAALLALTLGTFQTVIWNGDAAPGWARAIVLQLAPTLRAAPFNLGVARLEQPPAAYFVLGRCVWLVYAALLAAVAQRKVNTLMRAATLLLLGGAALADILVYGLSSTLGVAFRERMFWTAEVPLLAALTLLLTVSALLAWHQRAGSVIAALTLPLALAATAVLHYMPHGPLLGVALALLLEAYRESALPTAHFTFVAVQP